MSCLQAYSPSWKVLYPTQKSTSVPQSSISFGFREAPASLNSKYLIGFQSCLPLTFAKHHITLQCFCPTWLLQARSKIRLYYDCLETLMTMFFYRYLKNKEASLQKENSTGRRRLSKLILKQEDCKFSQLQNTHPLDNTSVSLPNLHFTEL